MCAEKECAECYFDGIMLKLFWNVDFSNTDKVYCFVTLLENLTVVNAWIQQQADCKHCYCTAATNALLNCENKIIQKFLFWSLINNTN